MFGGSSHHAHHSPCVSFCTRTPTRRQTPQSKARARKQETRGSEARQPDNPDRPGANKPSTAHRTSTTATPPETERDKESTKERQVQQEGPPGQPKQNQERKNRKHYLRKHYTMRVMGGCMYVLIFVICVLFSASKFHRAGLPHAAGLPAHLLGIRHQGVFDALRIPWGGPTS